MEYRYYKLFVITLHLNESKFSFTISEFSHLSLVLLLQRLHSNWSSLRYFGLLAWSTFFVFNSIGFLGNSF